MRLRVVVVAALLAAGAPASGGEGSAPLALLPDLVQKPPSVLLVTATRVQGERRFRLGFLSSFSNVGRGRLEIIGRRTGRGQTMRADQLVQLGDGRSRVRRGVGRLRYVKARTHEHWHLLPFDRYELWPAGAIGPILTHKSGFCLSDQFREYGLEPSLRRRADFRRECGPRAPGLRSLREGISVGWGDYYVPTLEGQYFDVTTLPAGEYVLVNTLNADRLLLESDPTNNSASVRLRLSWPNGARAKPRAIVIRVCPGSSRCPALLKP